MTLRTTFWRHLAALVALGFLLTMPAVAKTGDGSKKKGGETEERSSEETGGGRGSILRVPTQAFEVLENKVSKIQVYCSNYGIFGLNVAANRAGGVWPRGSGQAYIFGGGVWFGAEKVRNGDTNRLCVIGYNPNSGASWMVPGRINGPVTNSPLDNSADAWNRYRLYFSSDYNSFDGTPLDAADRDGPNWPIWDTEPNDTLRNNRYFGNYIEDKTIRNLPTFPKGPAIISGEDIFATYKDTDLGRYREISPDTARKRGYPIGIQVEQTIYSWGFGKYGDFLFVKYTIINKSGENLLNCYMAPALDMDIGAAANDRARIFIRDRARDSLNLAIQWSEREATGRFGYIGFDFLESPAVDPANGFLRKDKRVFEETEQIGLSTFQSWKIEEDPQSAEQRYSFMSAGDRDDDDGPGDKRFLTATGPFNMAPGDTARVVVGVMFAFGISNPPTGTEEDAKPLWEIDTFAQAVYDRNFLAPKAPDPAMLTWSPLNNGVVLSWDESSERSLDRQEAGLDFLGYTIRRSRKVVASNFATNDSITGWNIGWKTIGGFLMPNIPDTTTRIVAGRLNDQSVLGAWWRLPMLMDTVPGMTLTAYNIRRIDTLKRPGLADSLVLGDSIGRGIRGAQFRFDPYDDNNDDSTLFNSHPNSKFHNKAIRDIVREAITEIMDSLTNGRQFIDVGDDNGNGAVVSNDVDLSQNEQLINNVDYYYQILAFDAGSFEGTPSKSNSGIAGFNEIVAQPAAPPAGPRVKPIVVSTDGLMGVHDFKLDVLDAERLGQLFGGDTLEFTFEPISPLKYGFLNFWYTNDVVVRSRRSGQEVLRFAVNYDLNFTDRAGDSGNAALTPPRSPFYLIDSAFVKGLPPDHRPDLLRSLINGTFLADPIRPVFNTVGQYKNTWRVGFDYSIQQYGDSLRFGLFGDTSRRQSPFAVNSPSGSDAIVAPGRVVVGGPNTSPLQAVLHNIPSWGQPKIEIEFLPGGEEDVTFTENNVTQTVRAQFLTMRVRNVNAYTRKILGTNGDLIDSTIQYAFEYQPDDRARVKADTTESPVTLPQVIDVGKFATYAYGWVNTDGLTVTQRRNPFNRNRPFVGTLGTSKYYLGTPNRYYVGAYTADTMRLKFTHKVVVNGAEIYLDFSGMGAAESRIDSAFVPANVPTRDFQAGDKVTASFIGGAVGLPVPGAKVVVAIPSASTDANQITDNELDAIQVVPNPYLISHIGQPATTERRLYLTRLPERCTIEIFTESGELLETIEHDATTGAEASRVPVEVWDVLTRTNRLITSQLLIFRITTPNGAETIKKAAVVVGGYRLISR